MQIVEHQLGRPGAVEADAAGFAGGHEDVFRPIFSEEILDLADNGQVRLVGSDADEVVEAIGAEALDEGGAEERAATGNKDSRGSLHAASAVTSREAISLNAAMLWYCRACSASW